MRFHDPRALVGLAGFLAVTLLAVFWEPALPPPSAEEPPSGGLIAEKPILPPLVEHDVVLPAPPPEPLQEREPAQPPTPKPDSAPAPQPAPVPAPQPEPPPLPLPPPAPSPLPSAGPRVEAFRPPADWAEMDEANKLALAGKDRALVQVRLPEGATLQHGPLDLGRPDWLTVGPLPAAGWHVSTLTVRFPQPAVKPREVALLLRGGQLVPLVVPAPDTTRPELVVHGGHRYPVSAAALSQDEKRVLTCSREPTAVLWDAATGQPLHYLVGAKGTKAVAFAADGRRAFTGHEDGLIVVWDTATGRRLEERAGHASAIEVLLGSSDGKWLVSGDARGRVALWREGEEQPRWLAGHATLISCAAFSAAGTTVATGSHGIRMVKEDEYKYRRDESGEAAVRVWDVASGKELRRLDCVLFVTAIAFAPGGRAVATGDKEGVAWWDLRTGQRLGRAASKVPPAWLGFERDGQLLVARTPGGTRLSWDLLTGQPIDQWPELTLEGLSGIPTPAIRGVSVDGRKAVLSLPESNGEAELRDLTVKEGKERLARFTSTNDPVKTARFTPNGRFLLTFKTEPPRSILEVRSLGRGRFPDAAVLWDVASGQPVRTFRPEASAASSADLSADGKLVVVGRNDGAAVLFDAATGTALRTLPAREGIGEHRLPLASKLLAIAFSADGRQVIVGGERGEVLVWDAATGRRLALFQHDANVQSVALSRDGQLALSGSRMGKSVMLWDVAGGKPVRSYEGNSGVFSPDGRLLLTQVCDPSYIGDELPRLWSVADGQLVHALYRSRHVPARTYTLGNPLLGTPGTTYTIPSVQPLMAWPGRPEIPRTPQAFSRDGRLVAFTGGARIEIRETDTALELRTLEGHQGDVLSLAFTEDDRRLISTGSDSSVRLWDLATGDELARLVFGNDGRDLVALTPEGLFDAARSGRARVAFRVGGPAQPPVPLDRFLRDFYHPGLLAEVWRGERLLPAAILPKNPAPAVKVLVNAAAAGRVRLDVAVTDRGAGHQPPRLRHNGALRRNPELVRRDGETAHYRFVVELVPGANRFETWSATGNGAIESEPVAAEVPFAGKLPEPELYVLGVGIDRYIENTKRTNLECCIQDVKAVAGLLRRRAAFARVHVTTLLDEQATRQGILAAVADVARQAKPQDALVMFAAGHGFSVGQRYFFLPHELRFDGPHLEDRIRHEGLAADDLGEALAEVEALKRVLIFDTCRSGSAAGLGSGGRGSAFAFRGAVERFGQAQGVFMLAAAAADELAAENAGELGHSFLTYALLAAAGEVKFGPLEDKRLPAEGSIDVLEWFRFARQHVPALYAKYVGRPQHLELSGEDQPSFPLLRLKAP